MIYSVDQGDRGDVLVDGKMVDATDCETGKNGWAIVLKRDSEGVPVVAEDREGNRWICRERLDGEVEFHRRAAE